MVRYLTFSEDYTRIEYMESYYHKSGLPFGGHPSFGWENKEIALPFEATVALRCAQSKYNEAEMAARKDPVLFKGSWLGNRWKRLEKLREETLKTYFK